MTPVDLRHLSPPQPMEVILDAVEALPRGQSLAYVLPHHPTPLFPMLVELQVAYRCELSGDGGVILHLSKP